jgi:hypothetical protein
MFNPGSAIDVDMHDIDENLKQVQPDGFYRTRNDGISTEGIVYFSSGILKIYISSLITLLHLFSMER